MNTPYLRVRKLVDARLDSIRQGFQQMPEGVPQDLFALLVNLDEQVWSEVDAQEEAES